MLTLMHVVLCIGYLHNSFKIRYIYKEFIVINFHLIKNFLYIYIYNFAI